MIENGDLDIVMTRCLSYENQMIFVEMWPEKVVEYLSTLENHLEDGRGAYLSPEAEALYRELCEEDDNLPKLQGIFIPQSAGNCPFAGLANLL